MTTIGPSITIKGEVTSQEDMTVQGTVSGKISMQTGSLTVASGANVQAEAHVSKVAIQGTFHGDISAADRVELAGTANVNGTLVAPSIVIQDGAVFNGKIEVAGRNKGKAAAA